MLVTVTPELAKVLVRTNIPLEGREFFLTGSLIYGRFPEQAGDIDVVLLKDDVFSIPCVPDFITKDREWKESRYFPLSGYKKSIDGITYNLILVDTPTDYDAWCYATAQLAAVPQHLRPLDKIRRIANFEQYLNDYRLKRATK